MKLLLLILLTCNLSFAHKLYILADDDGKSLHVKSYFTKNATCKECQVDIYSPEGKLLNSKKTDTNGNAVFKLTNKVFDIEVTASMGHKHKITYESENEIAEDSIENNVTFSKIALSLTILAFIFSSLYFLKRKKMISTSIALVSTLIYSFGLSFFDTIYLSMFAPSLFLILLQKSAFVPTLKRLLFLNIFIVLVSASAFFNSQHELALLIFLRSNALILFTLLIFWGKDLFNIASAMQTLKIPDKLSAIFFFVAKFIVLIRKEFEITKKVMKTRNFHSKSNVFTYKIYANVIGVMIVKCFDKAEKLKQTMILRNFQGKIYQSSGEKFSLLDLVIFFLVVFSISVRIGEISL